MSKKFKHVIGLMSGTSLDGVDVVYVKMNTSDYSDFQICFSKTNAYDSEWVRKLKEAVHYTPAQLKELDLTYGHYLGDLTKKFVQQFKISTVDFIASHGHTVLHQPEKGITLQIGNGQQIANQTNCSVICDFRTQDVALGGQGAPLVPMGDQLLFAQFEACVNLGGFANISYQEKDRRIAFDICPVNTVMNLYAQQLGQPYDSEGLLARAGAVHEDLLERLNTLSFYQKKPPKSLGIEWVHKQILPLLKDCEISTEDVLRTFLEHCAIQIGKVLPKSGSVLFTGGGTYNQFLMERIKQFCACCIHIPDDEIIEYKESLIFALLGLLKFQGKVNCLSSVTGASTDHSSGRIFNPNFE